LTRAPSLPPPIGLDRCHALLAYEGSARELVARLKYRNARDSVRWLAAAMATLVSPVSPADTVVTWVPTSRRRQRERGFDQAQLLARRVAAELRLPCRVMLRRRDGPPQTGRSGLERLQGPTFAAVTASLPQSVIVVDDVVTTGATLTAAARTLHAGGVTVVDGLVAARTPLKRRPARSDTNGDDDEHRGPVTKP
jgi:ComF family protein